MVYSAKQSPSGKKEPWTITTVHTNGTIRIQCRTTSERINIRRVTPFSEEQHLQWYLLIMPVNVYLQLQVFSA
jgi:hypothetical protein